MTGGKLYFYVGSEKLKKNVGGQAPGRAVREAADVRAFLDAAGLSPGSGGDITVTFVVDGKGVLRIADRHSEHVACAGGGPVMSAGEMTFLLEKDRVSVSDATNQSTGYCPEPESWEHVRTALEGACIPHPGCFTHEFVFRRCEKCGGKNIVKEDWFVCPVCGATLPDEWNFR